MFVCTRLQVSFIRSYMYSYSIAAVRALERCVVAEESFSFSLLPLLILLLCSLKKETFTEVLNDKIPGVLPCFDVTPTVAMVLRLQACMHVI